MPDRARGPRPPGTGGSTRPSRSPSVSSGGFLSARAGRRQVTLEPAAARALVAFIGNDLQALDDAVERLSLYAGGAGTIREADVGAVVDDSRLRSVFDLTDAIGRRDAAAAMATLAKLFGQGEEGIPLNHLVARQMRQLLACAESPGLPADRLASVLGVPPFVSRKLAEQCRRFRAPELRRALRIAAETDRDLKSSRLPDQVILERAVLAMCFG